MTLNDILKQSGIGDDVITAILEAMKENRIFTASEENLDIRYGKLKGDHEAVQKQLGEANTLIDTLKKSTKGQEEAQQRITTYEQQVAQLQAELESTRFDAEAKVGLLTAKATDVDYALYKLKEAMRADGKEPKVDENGKIPGWADLLSSLQTQIPKQFEAAGEKGGYQVLEPNSLKKGEGGNVGVTKERFATMGYEERMNLKAQNEQLYNSFVK